VVVVFIRRVRTASGATAVQIAEYVGGRQRIVAHVGSARSQAELGVLVARARALLEPPGQDALDLGVEPTPAVTPVVAPATQRPVLFAAAGSGERHPVRASAARVLRTDAGVLFEVLAEVYAGWGSRLWGTRCSGTW
jgi:hypothetical protein